MPFACIFVPDFPVEALLRAEPELRSQPVAVLEGKAPLQKVFAGNEKARRAGVEVGMTKLQIEACTDFVLRSRSPLQEAAAHAALLDCAQSFSPRIEDAGDDAILLDLAGLEPLFGPLPKIARDLARRASELGLEANIAVASNPDTAMLAARGFSGVTVIPAGREADQLSSLPVAVLFVGAVPSPTLETFDRWGVRNLRGLAALPDVALSERLGQEGVRLQQLARGSISRTLVPVEPPLIFEEAVELEYPLMLLEPLAFLLSRLLEQLCARLGARALATQELRLHLELENGWHAEDDCCPIPALDPSDRRIFQRTLRLPVPLLDARIFLKLLQLDLKTNPPGAPIAKIYLSAEPVRPRAAQSGLFLPPSPEPEKLELTLARISGIVGEGSVGSLDILDTHHPHGFRMRHFAPAEPKQVEPHSKHISESNSAITALRIFRPPLPATVTLRHGKPSHIVCSKQIQGDILWTAGPWRSSGDWWEQEGWSRDEWDIAVQVESHIALYRLVHDRLSGRWFLEGNYD
jgi:protein ImuB